MAFVISVGYTLYFIDRGWIPHDEGALAHSAERVLAGELPHRDFVDGYTGGASYLNALAFRIFGIHLLAIRYALFAVFAAWVVVFYRAATKLVSPLAACVVTLIAVFWSVPNYPAAMPSWYNLFLATGGVAALLEYIDSAKRRWLFTAGFLGGLSVLMKTTGVLFIAAGLLFLLYHESVVGAHARDDRKSGVVPLLAIVAILISAVVALLAIGTSRHTWIDLYQFAIPGLAMVALVARKLFVDGRPSRTTSKLIIRAGVPYVIGAVIPVAAFLAHYAAANAIPHLVQDLVLLPARFVAGASVLPPVPLGLIPLAVAVFIAIDATSRRIAILQHGLIIALLVLMLAPRSALMLEPFVWASLAGATPVVILTLAVLITRGENREGASANRSRAVLVGSVAAFCSLVQYPFAAPVYFSYSLPLLALAVVATLQDMSFLRKGAVKGIALVYLVFGALYLAPMKVPGLVGPVAREDTAILELPRGGLRIGREDAKSYVEAARLLQAKASSGVIYVGPDAPELYFLAELKNPTPAIFDYVVPDTLFYEHLLQRLDSLGVNAIALRRRVVHSPPLRPHIRDALVARFPFAREVGRFTIRWRE